MTRRRRRVLLPLASAIAPLLPIWLSAIPADTAAAPSPPSVLSEQAAVSGIELHVVPGQYHPTFDSAFVESAPYASTAADSTPSASATAAPLDMSALDNYPDVACVLSIFAPYCPQIRRMPVDTFIARADADAGTHQDRATSFPCAPGESEPSTAAVSPPPCPAAAGPPPLAGGTAHADSSPGARADAVDGPLTITAPPAAAAAYRARLDLARNVLAAPAGTSLAAAEADATLLRAASIRTHSEVHLDAQGRPVLESVVTIADVDALGGMIHADAVVLDARASTLGERHPQTAQSVHLAGLQVLGRSLGDVDAADCGAATSAVDAALNAFGFALHCGTATTTVVTDPAKGFGLDPVVQEVSGPAITFVQPVDPLDQLRSHGVDVPVPCYPGAGLPPPPSPPSVPAPVPTPGMPSSSCQFLSSNSFGDNAFSLLLGHVRQRLTAQPPVGADATTLSAPPALSASMPGTDRTTTLPPVASVPAHSAAPQGSPAPAAGSTPAQLVASRSRPLWLLFAFGAWETSVLAALALWAALLHRRRRSEGAL